MWQARITLRPGARGPAVADLRWRLVRLGRLAADGGAAYNGYDEALQAVVRAFQAEEGLVPDGIVGPATWNRLYAVTSPTARSMRLGPGGPPSALDGASAALSTVALKTAAFPVVSSTSPSSPWTPPAAEPRAARIEVQLTPRRLVLHTPHGIAAFPVAVGCPEAPTPTGHFTVAELIPYPGPPLGTRWIRLQPDICSIHGTDEPWLVGGAVTPGCLRLYNKDVEFVFHRVAPGTPVDIYA